MDSSSASRRAALVAGFLLGTFAASAAAQFPAKSIRIIVPFPPGAFNDTLGRVIAQKFVDGGVGQAVVDNRPGSGSVIGADLAAKSPPDGHTLLIVAFPFAVNASLYAKIPYNTVRDFQPIVHAAATSNLFVLHPSVPAKDVKELIALARSRPGQMTYASSGAGSSNHISIALFESMTATKLVHVPYKGSAPAVTDLIGGHTTMMTDNVPNVIGHAKAGKLRAIAVTGAKRNALAPEVPTVAEAGVPGYELDVWFGVVAPAGVPRPIVERLNAEINKVLALPDVRERFLTQGVEPVGGSAEKFGAHIRAEVEKWGKVVRATGARVD